MPKVRVNGAELYYEDTGGEDKANIVFSHGLLFSCRMFDEQVKVFQDRYRCIAYDHRGQGQSEITASGYDMETLYQDVVALIETLKIAPCHFVGLSMGGFMGMRLAARRPELLKSLILLETSADPEPSENIPRYRTLNLVARWLGLSLIANQVMPIVFAPKFLNDPLRAPLREQWKRRLIANHRIGITRAVKGVIERKGIYDEIGNITVPTLIMVGDHDVATVPAKSERIHERIANSKLVLIPNAGHSSTIEEPEFINQQIDAFLKNL